MIGTPNGYFSTSHSSFHSDENSETEAGLEDQKRHSSVPSSPVEERKYCPTYSSTVVNRKERKSYGWSPYSTTANYSTYDNNDNVTNAPLNLSVNGNDSLEPEVIKHATPQLLSLPNSTSGAQLILTSGQMVQGIQGAQLFVPTSQGLAKQIVLTIPITHVTTDQVINLSLTDGQIIPTTVGELLKLAMPKSMFEDDVTGEKIINELMKLSGQSSLYIAEYLKSALKHSKNKYYDEPKRKGKCESDECEGEKAENENENGETKDDEKEDVVVVADEKPEIMKRADLAAFNGSYKKIKDSGHSNVQHQQNDSPRLAYSRRKHNMVPNNFESTNVPDATLTPKQKSSSKRSHDSKVYSEVHPQKIMNNNQRSSNDFPLHLFAHERPDKNSVPTTITREEPTSTMNHENENGLKYDPNFRHESSSPTDSYDENDLDDIKEFAKSFKLRRLSMGLTQTQVGQALNIAEGPAYSQSAICSALASHVYAAQIASQQHSIFEKLDITPKSAQKIKPVLERWMKEAEERYRNGQGLLTEFIGMESSKKRKRRTSFTPQALEILNSHFEHNTHPSGTEITALAHQLGYDREVIRIWFCNKRQALKNTVRMMSKHIM